jgi:hypothetical protein
MMEFRRFIELLVVAYPPETGLTIRDWIPFDGGDSLEMIISSYNKRCFETYQKFDWFDDRIKKGVKGIDIAPCDLSTVPNLCDSDFADIGIILIDLDAVGGQTKMLSEIKERMESYKPYHLPQVTQRGAKSLRPGFKRKKVIPSIPEIISDQAAFENWLLMYCTFVSSAYDNMPHPNTQWADEVLLKAAENVRDIAMKKNLSKEKIKPLAYWAANLELAMAPVEELVRTRTNRSVVLNAIREPIFNMPSKIYLQNMPSKIYLQTPALQRVNLVEVHLTHPMRELTTEQRYIAVDLGIQEETFAVVHFRDTPHFWDGIKSLKDVAETSNVSADLPVRLMGKMGL